MKAAFLILSALNQHAASVSDALAQLQQRLITLNRDFEHSPNALIEYSDIALSDEQKQQLLPHADLLAEFRPNNQLIKLKAGLQSAGSPVSSTSYHELLKIIALNWFLQNAHGTNLFKDIDYVVILESGAEIGQDLVNLLNKSEALKNKFFFKKALTSSIQNKKGRTLMYYPTDTWAYSAELTDELIDNIIDASENAYKRLEKVTDHDSSTDLGHELFKAIDLSKIHFLI
ncbi:MAG: hypothetical protein GX822_07415 [Alcaligenaceae bacterium]|jgi:hypothetical protein|nr:hypothetical protein [Alcaligenaceae bacterium]